MAVQSFSYQIALLLTKYARRWAIFTDSALWAGSVIESPCPCVCLSVCYSVPSGAVFLERSSSHHNFHTVRARDLKFWHNVHHPLCVTCHMSRVTCHVSRVTCHVSHVIFLIFFFGHHHPPIRSYDPHRSRESVSPVCGILNFENNLTKCTAQV